MSWRDRKLGVLLAICSLPLACLAHDNTNDYLFIDRRSNAVFDIAGITNSITPLAESNGLRTLWFPVGEEMSYDIYWGLIHVGTTRVITDWVAQDGQPRLRIRHITKTNRVVAQVYPVNDRLETIIDPEPFLPVYFRKTLSEGHYHADEITTFDYEAGIAREGSFRDGHVKGFKLAPDTRDIVTLMYWLRRSSFEVGITNQYRVVADEKMYDLFVKPTGGEKQEVGDYGTVGVVRLDPEAAFNGLFMRKGKMAVWVSDDNRRLCTKIEAEVPVANIHIVLNKVSGPGNDAWVGSKKK